MTVLRTTAAAVALTFASAGLATAASQSFFANLVPLNGSGVTGRANLTYDDTAGTLFVSINASGLADGLHPQHIHGCFTCVDAADPTDSEVPPASADEDGDNFVEIAEGADFYGPIILSLTSPPGGALAGFPSSTGGSYHFEQLYDLSDASIFADGFTASDLFPLTSREIVIHGMFVTPGVQETDSNAEGPLVYSALTPASAGEIQIAPVPLPAAGLLLLGAFGGLTLLRRKA